LAGLVVFGAANGARIRAAGDSGLARPNIVLILADDPGEAHDLASVEPARLAELGAKLRTWKAAVGARDPQPNPAVPDPPLLGWETLGRPDRLAEYRPAVEVGCVSSYDRTGGNDDGFSGKYSFVRKEPGSLVLAELNGPGVIYRLWTPTPTDDWLEFHIDGEAAPRIRVRFRDLFLGRQDPFVAPLTGYGLGGFFSYVPIAYARSCKVLLRAERAQFYQINFARYAPGTPIEPFDARSPGFRAGLERARQVLGKAGGDLAREMAPPGQPVERVRQTLRLAASNTVAWFERHGGGRLVGLRLGPVDRLCDKARRVVLRISFDGETPSVQCPAADFFGFAWGKPAAQSLLVGSDPGQAYCYFPMPFERGVKVELVADATLGEPIALEGEVCFCPTPRRSGEGRFQAVWRRENPTRAGEPFTFVETAGQGHLVGFALQAQGLEPGKTLFFEGDDQTWLDGRLAVHGTGSEDFFNGGWYDVPDRWEKRWSFPLSGCLGYEKHLGRTGGFRLLMGEAYSFSQTVRQTIEHSGTGNDIPTDYTGVTYLYSDRPPAALLDPANPALRPVADPREVVFAAWWQIPIRAFPFQNATLSRKVLRLGKEDVQYLAFRGGAPDWVGPPYLYLTCNVPAAGRYAVSIEVLRGPECGRVQLFENEVPAGEPVDLYASQPAKSPRLNLGTLTLAEGDNPLMLKLVGKHEQATALGMDLIHIVCTRAD
jgi:hypothetical protein